MATPKIRLKGCPRCSGDLLLDRSDNSASSYACLQCGREFPVTMFMSRPSVPAAVAMPQPAVAFARIHI